MMHTAQMLIGGTVIAGLASLAASPFLPSVPPIQIHALMLRDGKVIQSRTVTADGEKFFAKWQAQIEDAETGAIVCEGSGSWNYDVGKMDVEMTLERWVGQDDCTYESLPDGEYVPVATWYWGSDQTSYKGQEFTK